MKPISNRTRKWIRAGVETLIHGGTAALISGLALPMQDPKDYALFSAAWWQMVGMMFAGNGGVRFLQWWQANPLPPEGDSASPFPTPQPMISMNPLAQVAPLTMREPVAVPPKTNPVNP